MGAVSSGCRPRPTRATARVAPTGGFPATSVGAIHESPAEAFPLRGRWPVGPDEVLPRLPPTSNRGRRGRRPLQGAVRNTVLNPPPQGEVARRAGRGPHGPSHAAGIFHTRSVFHMPQAYFTRSAGTNFTDEKQPAGGRFFSSYGVILTFLS